MLSADFDVAHLAAQSGGDQDVAREVLSLFVARAPALLSRIADGGADARDAAHALKGAALAIGAWRVAAAAEATEAAAAASLRPPCAELASAVSAACAEALRLLQNPRGPLAMSGTVA
jgi:HPt (histidine-containing phosphotransfer) domain-containing protein